jgi:hypothetical protein
MVARRGATLALFAAALLVALVAGCGAEPDAVHRVPPAVPPGAGTSPTPAPGPMPTLSPTAAPTPSPAPPPESDDGPQATVPVYFVNETAAGYRLQREFHRVAAGDPASAAVREMLANFTGADPDYRTYWPAGTTLRAPVTQDAGVIVVDLAGTGSATLGAGLAELTVQQLVFTVQGALQSSSPVRILVDGQHVPELWGAVDTSAPVERGDPYAVRSLVQIDAPVDGAQVGREVEVSGEAAVFEATVPWEVLQDGALVQKGFASTSEGQRFAPFRFTVTLEPGDYTVRIREDDPSGGEGRPVLTDDKTFTVD